MSERQQAMRAMTAAVLNTAGVEGLFAAVYLAAVYERYLNRNGGVDETRRRKKFMTEHKRWWKRQVG